MARPTKALRARLAVYLTRELATAKGRTEVARRCETRLLAATADTLEPRHYAQTRMNRPLLTFTVKRTFATACYR